VWSAVPRQAGLIDESLGLVTKAAGHTSRCCAASGLVQEVFRMFVHWEWD
jgi:hypothetical protein